VDLYVMINVSPDHQEFVLPPNPAGHWWRVIDTALEPPLDIAEAGKEGEISGKRYGVAGGSAVVLVSERPPAAHAKSAARA
jgi:hypothetical protein